MQHVHKAYIAGRIHTVPLRQYPAILLIYGIIDANWPIIGADDCTNKD